MNGKKAMWQTLKKLPRICLLPGFVAGLYIAEKYRKPGYRWTCISLRNIVIRLLFALFVLGMAYLFRWAVDNVASSTATAVARGCGAYVAGAVLAYVLPMLTAFPEGREDDLEQRLVEA